MGITIRDVAAAAGVSTATVSRALRGLPHVDEATRAKVMAAARELDYVVSPSASRLASGRTGSIAFITPYIARWFFSTVLAGVESVLQSTDTDLLLFRVGDPAAEEHRIPTERRLRRRVDAALVVSLPVSDPSVQALLDAQFPVGLIGEAALAVPSVAIDDVEAARTATQHLLNLGHERIGLIGGQPIASAFAPHAMRHRGYEEAMASAGLKADAMLQAYGYFTIEGGEQAMTSLLSRPSPPTAVFAMSDEMAFGAMWALRRHGLVPGQDVSVIGIDGHSLSEVLGLTSVEQPVEEMGRIAAESLMSRLAGHPQPADIEPVMMPTRLVARMTTAPLRT